MINVNVIKNINNVKKEKLKLFWKKLNKSLLSKQINLNNKLVQYLQILLINLVNIKKKY